MPPPPAYQDVPPGTAADDEDETHLIPLTPDPRANINAAPPPPTDLVDDDEGDEADDEPGVPLLRRSHPDVPHDPRFDRITPSVWKRAALLAVIVLLFYVAGRLQGYPSGKAGGKSVSAEAGDGVLERMVHARAARH
ncbi:hypothetical protein HMN09_01365100 [Mycena chlorophos]|uniref:Uncharacterized protein n=1 Tax=Mycena chlorophos TaxID=658473 RepID=A0A8H6RXR2_MYCCL|nr:hypothetical protein HMN09_01365100 [Mycena chlorophos]